jgi:Transcriptional regulators
MIFTYQQIAQLNDTETSIYQYIINHMESVLKMSVRDLANETYVSTATIVRFCQKMGCDGFVDFKAQLKLFHEGSTPPVVDDEIDVLLDFFNYTKGETFKKSIQRFVEHIQEASTICFIGIGSSGTLGEFAARYFSNIGYFSWSISDPYYPPLITHNDNHLLIVLSESGETREVIDQIRVYQSKNTKILTITNKPGSTIDRMADGSIYYFVQDVVLPQTYNISSQVPVLYIIERLTRELQRSKKKSLPLKTSTRNYDL